MTTLTSRICLRLVQLERGRLPQNYCLNNAFQKTTITACQNWRKRFLSSNSVHSSISNEDIGKSSQRYALFSGAFPTLQILRKNYICHDNVNSIVNGKIIGIGGCRSRTSGYNESFPRITNTTQRQYYSYQTTTAQTSESVSPGEFHSINSKRSNSNKKKDSSTFALSSKKTTPRFPADFVYDPEKLLADLKLASRHLPRKPPTRIIKQQQQTFEDSSSDIVKKEYWDPEFCLRTFQSYKDHLLYLHTNKQKTTVTEDHRTNKGDSDSLSDIKVRLLTSAYHARSATMVLVKSNLTTEELQNQVRQFERILGDISTIPMNDQLSQELYVANAKAGNVGRTFELLRYRTQQSIPPFRDIHDKYMRYDEYSMAIQSIISATVELRRNRSPIHPESESAVTPLAEDPTRWLDYILLSMKARNVDLTTAMAGRMLSTYACSGRTGRATHFFYKVETRLKQQDADSNYNSSSTNGHNKRNLVKVVRLKRNRSPKPHKVPSISRNILRSTTEVPTFNDNTITGSKSSTGDVSNQQPRQQQLTSRKLELEMKNEWSPSLSAAFAFAQSLEQGACGHEPVKLDVRCYNFLIKACCHRGALQRAIWLLTEKMPELGLKPNEYSYNTILHALARVGDEMYLTELLIEMTNNPSLSLTPNSVEALVLGKLNAGNVGGAITLIQDIYNQHGVLPPSSTHLDVLEHALGHEYVHEAKRHIWFLEQIKQQWRSSDEYMKAHTNSAYTKNWDWKRLHDQVVKGVIHNPKLSRDGIKHLFQFFGETLTDDSFL
mmetsp:Transcript_19931/g.24412  ORF Transcript_19931/g.24412 Transcript_19931/m.24412 type:complete len:777 (+) Transcript_19931:39-2369(+)